MHCSPGSGGDQPGSSPGPSGQCTSRPSAKEIADAPNVAFHAMNRQSFAIETGLSSPRAPSGEPERVNAPHPQKYGSNQAAPVECDLADVHEVLFREPYHPWSFDSLRHVCSGVTMGWWNDRSRHLVRYLLKEIQLAFVIVFAQIPETISFAMISNMDPAMGLHGAWMIGSIVAIFGGRPGMVSGVTGSVSTITGALIAAETPLRLIWPIIITAGTMVMIFSLMNLSFVVRFISKNVMIGFCNGVAIIIAVSQLHMFHDAQGYYVTGEKAFHMAVECITAIVTFQFWPKIPCISRIFPSALVAVAATLAYDCVIVQLWRGIQTTTVRDIGAINTNHFRFPKPFWMYPEEIVALDYRVEDIGTVLTSAIALFLVISIESLMTITVLDRKTGQLTSADQSLLAIGAGNVVSGLLGGLGGTAMMGLTNLLHSSGGVGKEAPLVCAIFVFITTAGLSEAINLFPTAGLAGIMFVVAAHTFSFDSIVMVVCSFLPERILLRWPKLARAIPIPDALILLTVTIMIPTIGVDIGIITGVMISLFYFVDKIFSQMSLFKHFASREGIGLVAVYDICGPIFFSSTDPMQRSFDVAGDPPIIIIRMSNSNLMDYSALEAIASLRQQYESYGKRLIVKNLKRECEVKLLRSQARLEWDKDRDHMTDSVDVNNIIEFIAEMPDLPAAYKPCRTTTTAKDSSVFCRPRFSSESIDPSISFKSQSACNIVPNTTYINDIAPFELGLPTKTYSLDVLPQG